MSVVKVPCVCDGCLSSDGMVSILNVEFTRDTVVDFNNECEVTNFFCVDKGKSGGICEWGNEMGLTVSEMDGEECREEVAMTKWAMTTGAIATRAMAVLIMNCRPLSLELCRI